MSYNAHIPGNEKISYGKQIFRKKLKLFHIRDGEKMFEPGEKFREIF